MRHSSAFIASIALHALLLVGLALLWQSEPSAASGTSVVRVALMRFAGSGVATGERGGDTETSTVAEVAPGENVEETAPPLEDPVAEDPPAAEPIIADTRPVEPDPVEPATDAPPIDRAATDPAAPPDTETTVAADPPQETQLRAFEREAEAQPEADVEPERATLAVAQAELEMLDRRITELAARLEDAEPQADTKWQHRGQTYSATLTRMPAEHSMGIDELKVAVRIEQNGSRWSTEMRLKRLAFSSFAQFVDRWDPEVQIHDDEIDGRFHSNSEIFVSRTGRVQPAFHGKVTTASDVNTSRSERYVRRDDVFLGGLETRVARILLPKRVVPFPMPVDTDVARTHEITADARVTFYADGSYGWQYLESVAPEQRVSLGAEPHYLVAAEEAALHLRGTVNGKVLVYSPTRIVIEDDLTYAVDPAESDSDDYLGLVSEGNVEVAEPETTGIGDLTVHAAIYAKRRFVVRSFRAAGTATLYVYGSIAAGSVSATEPRFRTKLQFDDRLENLRPPSFPLTDRYEISAWDGRWTMEPE